MTGGGKALLEKGFKILNNLQLYPWDRGWGVFGGFRTFLS